jgi:hypothetical protein
MMRRSALLVAIAASMPAARAQHPVVQGAIEAIRIDSLMLWAGELSGETAVQIAGSPQTIVSRNKFSAGNALAQAWLEQKLAALGYAVTVQSFSSSGKNLLATKPGNGSTSAPVIICAHYDAMPGGIYNAPAADDDGSGTVAVLEAARVLRDIGTVHPIVFALWDEEEYGKVGSAWYASAMAASDAPIHAVVNMDAIAYDGNNDSKARVHVRQVANSTAIADSVFAVRDHYGIALDLIRVQPGLTYSDHASFWTEGYGAVLMIEDFENDGNPYYHTPNDRVQYLNVPYFEKLAKLSIATALTLAQPLDGTTASSHPDMPMVRASAYPNPATGDAELVLDWPVSARGRISLLDATGREAAVLHDGLLVQGNHRLALPLARMAPGAYLVRAVGAGMAPMSLRVMRKP